MNLQLFFSVYEIMMEKLKIIFRKSMEIKTYR